MKRWTAAFLTLIQLFASFGPGATSALAQYNVRVQVQTPVTGVNVAPIPGGALAPLAAPNLSFKPTLAAPGVLPTPTLPSVLASAPQASARVALHAAPSATAEASPILKAAQAPSAASVVLAAPAAPAARAVSAQGAQESRNSAAELTAAASEMSADMAKGSAETSFAALLGQRLVKTSGDVAGPTVFAVPGAELRGRSANLAASEPSRPVAKAEPAAPKSASTAPSFWSKPALRWAAAGLGVVAVAAALPLLTPHAGVVAALGSAALTVIGVPQIVKNFRGGKATVKDLVLSGNLIWFGAATLLSVVSIGNGASLWWNLANVAGVLESAIVVGQINAYRRDKAEMKATALTAVGAAALVGLIVAQAFMPLKAWLDLSFTAAMGLLWVLNAPQIRHNHKVWLKEGRVADGIAPLYPALVAGGSLLHLFTALVTGDVRWAINAVIGIVTASIVLGQIYAPKATNGLLAPIIRLLEKAFARFAPRSLVVAAFAGASLAAFAGHDAAGQVAAVVEKAKALPGRSVIFLEAPTAAGKSTLAKSLEGALVGRLRALEIDRYYGNVADAPRDAEGRPDFDRPDAIKLDRAARDIRALLAGERVELPSYDMTTGLSRAYSGEFMQLDADDVLLIDSIFASHPLLKAAAEGRQALDVYMAAPAVVRLARGAARDKVQRGKPVEYTLRGWARILENEAAYIKPLRAGADAVINLVTPEELAGLPAAYEKLLADEKDPAVRALMGEMIRASLRADGVAR